MITTDLGSITPARRRPPQGLLGQCVPARHDHQQQRRRDAVYAGGGSLYSKNFSMDSKETSLRQLGAMVLPASMNHS